jgi:ABC-type uncharacterized transport system ATPase subunit
LRLAPSTDATAALDAVRAHAAVTDFGVEAPSLSELFLQVAGESAEVLDDAELTS